MTQRDGGYDNLILNCKIYNIGCGGIILDGGNRMDLIKGNNRVVGCEIHDFNRLEQSYRPGIGAFGCGNVFIDVNGVFHREKGTYSYDPYAIFNMTGKQREKWEKTYPEMRNYTDMENNIELAHKKL